MFILTVKKFNFLIDIEGLVLIALEMGILTVMAFNLGSVFPGKTPYPVTRP
jgi:hypothetical protein